MLFLRQGYPPNDLCTYLHSACDVTALELDTEQRENVSLSRRTGNHGLFFGLMNGSASLFFFGGRTRGGLRAGAPSYT